MLLKKNNGRQNRGRPTEWTDEELMQLALDIKYKYHGKKLTPSFLEQETKVGRNTWSRRMKNYIDELNEPVLSTVPIGDANETLLPSVDLIFQKYGNDELALKNELLDLEILLYDIYKELQEYKQKEERYENGRAEVQALKDEVVNQKRRAGHYEQLYNNIVVSSVYPHLQGVQDSQIHQLNIKDKLIDMEDYKGKSTDLESLSSYFPDVPDESNIENDTNEQQSKNMQKLLSKFDV